MRTRLLIFVTGVLFSSWALAATYVKPGFPRLGGVNNGAPQNYDSPAYQAKLAKLDVVILAAWPGMKPGGVSMNTIVSNIKAINPNERVFLYTKIDNIGSSSAWSDFRNKIESMKWFLYQSGRSGSPTASSFGSSYPAINFSSYAPRDGSGYSSAEWIARYHVENLFKPNSEVEGFFLDDLFWKPRISADWNLDGSSDSPTSTVAGSASRAGYRKYFDVVKSLMPGRLQIANVADWGANDAVFPELKGIPNGGLIEGIIGKSYSPETWGSWQTMMDRYRKVIASVAEPKLVIFNAAGSPTDYQTARYALASCLQDDGYFAFTDVNVGYTGVVWFDEYNANLGQATSTPSNSDWQNGVYRRDFENGIALVNPKGNGTVTVTLETDYRRLSGSQSPSVNSGQVTRTVTLKDRDGIILMRTSAAVSTTAKPAAPQSVVVE